MSSDKQETTGTYETAQQLSETLKEIQEVQRQRELANAANPRFFLDPDHYDEVAALWLQRDRWMIEEAANLLAGCDPNRPINLPGEQHVKANTLVHDRRILLLSCIGISIERVGEKGWFKNDYIKSTGIVEWALGRDLDVPEGLIRASNRSSRTRREWSYSTPQLEAVFWVIENFWEGIDPQDSAKQATVIDELRQKFPNLTEQDYKRVDQVTRHPSVTRGRRRQKLLE